MKKREKNKICIANMFSDIACIATWPRTSAPPPTESPFAVTTQTYRTGQNHTAPYLSATAKMPKPNKKKEIVNHCTHYTNERMCVYYIVYALF